MTRKRRRLARDKRGAGVAEYALLLFLVVAAVGLTFRYMGKNVKRAGDKTEEQFQGGSGGQSGGKSAQGAAGAGSAGGADTTGAAGTAAGAAGGAGNTTAAGGAGGGAGGGAAGSKTSHRGPSGAAADETPDDEGTPIWKIIGAVVVLLFCVAGYFAFRKQKGSG
ncbi:MAG TPA: hypothetical protein VGH28_28365 [Polyangiaceae bacterium]|jgi:Flp pilus assembly pilin Flp